MRLLRKKTWFCNLFAIFGPAEGITIVSAVLMLVSPPFQNNLFYLKYPHFAHVFRNCIIAKLISYILNYGSHTAL